MTFRTLARLAPLLGLVVAMPAAAQDDGGARGAASITEADVARRIGIIAHDSMGGRSTPSRGLDLTASWIAAEFARLGLKPGGDSGRFEQRYPLTRIAVDTARSGATLVGSGKKVMLPASRDLFYASGPRSDRWIEGPVVLMAAPTVETSASAPVEGKVIVVVGAVRSPGGSIVRALQPALDRKPAAVLIVSTLDSATFARQVANQVAERVSLGAGPNTPLIVMVRESAVAGVLQAAGVSVSAMRQVASPVTRDLPVTVSVRVQDRPGAGQDAPNVVGILPGSDPVLRNEYVVFSAHMDHVGTDATAGADTIFNGADDDASGTAGIVELAEAFAQPGARPRRSLIFLTVSGEERGLWGSDYFTSHPPVPTEQMVANFNIDMIGRNWKDTIVAIGKEHSDLGSTLNTVNGAHPELGMTAIDDPWPQENFYMRSDHYHFARRGVPVLFFFNGTHADYHEPGDSPDRIDSEKEARILRLVYWLGREVGNRDVRPQWNEAMRKKVTGR
ncbi:MAG: M28 family peptidase [Cytophagaceae bacterium]|nr:M28 family peptidase [Gemmatimonadaceae bacterium]